MATNQAGVHHALREHRSASEWVSDDLAMTCGYGGASNACLTADIATHPGTGEGENGCPS